MASELNRRTFVKQSVAASAGAALVMGASGGQAAEPAAAKGKVGQPTPQSTLPKGKIGDLQISRLLLGGNLLTHFTHSRDLKYVYNLAKHYNTDERILKTLSLAEAHGINTLVIHTAGKIIDLLKKYREEHGGKIQWIVCPTAPIEDGLVQFNQQVQRLVDDGVDAVYIWGVRSDQLVSAGKVDLLAKAVAAVKVHGVPCGVGAHLLEVIVACEKRKLESDFYIKTLHHHNYPSAKLDFDSDWCHNPEEVIEFMHTVSKPWIAFKVMAAGAIPPQNAFRFAFENGADLVLAGMFDFEIAEDVRITNEVLPSLPKRTRPWRA